MQFFIVYILTFITNCYFRVIITQRYEENSNNRGWPFGIIIN